MLVKTFEIENRLQITVLGEELLTFKKEKKRKITPRYIWNSEEAETGIKRIIIQSTSKENFNFQHVLKE